MGDRIEEAPGAFFEDVEASVVNVSRVNQLGANLWEVARDWRGLWLLTIVYFTVAVVSARVVAWRRSLA